MFYLPHKYVTVFEYAREYIKGKKKLIRPENVP